MGGLRVTGMTIQEIKTYLKKSWLEFKYGSKFYCITKERSLFATRYCLYAADWPPQRRNSLEELLEQVYISEDTLLIDAIEHIELPPWPESVMETYEGIRYFAIVCQCEINFVYNNGREYWITHPRKDLSGLYDDLGNAQEFRTASELFEKARIDGKTLQDIWEEVTVYSY